MTDPIDDPLPKPLQRLADDLGAPGPALPLGSAEEQALIARALHSRSQHSPASSLRARRMFRVAALVLVGSSAAAALVQSVVSQTDQAGIAPARAPEPLDRPQPHARPPLEEVQKPLAESGAASAAADRPQAAHSAPAVASNAPEDLLSKANRLRREGRPREAEAAYLEMVNREPGSVSGYVARVAVAELRLNQNPKSSIELFRAAQQRFPRGTLDVEIRRGLASAYRATGNAAQERRELEQLVARYPKGAAAEWARERLAGLEAPRPQ